MRQFLTVRQWFIGVVSCLLVLSLLDAARAADTELARRSPVTLIVVMQEVGDAGVQVVEETLIRAFLAHGYRVLDRAVVARALPPAAEQLPSDGIAAATRFGARLGADFVISGRAQTRTLEKSYSLLEGKRVIVSQADVGATAISVRSGEVLAAESAHARKPFDTTGAIALEAAAEALADKLIKGIMYP
jgi:hypothetical protein